MAERSERHRGKVNRFNKFVVGQQKIGIMLGPVQFFGTPVSVYADEAAAAIDVLGDEIDRAAVKAVWENAVATSWTANPQWFHGDVAADNLQTHHGKLTAVVNSGPQASETPPATP